MQVWLLDYEKFIKVNDTQPVTDPIMFNSGNVPTTGGLFSTSIFGTSTRERRETFAYIDLKGYYINPKVYISLKRLNRNFESVIYGTKKYTVDKDGVLKEDENGGTGIKWLYDNWDKIKFARNNSNQRNERIDLITNNPKNIIFTNKFLVLPAFYRDVNIQSSDENTPKVPEINGLYAKIIRNVQTIEDSTTMQSILLAMSGKVQDLIVDIYNLIKDKIQGKSGYIRQFLMGKSIDYCSRVVITGTPYRANSVYDQNVDFYHTGIPLAQVASEFTPFIIFWLKNWFKNNFENQANSYIHFDEKGEKHLVKLDNPQTYFNEEYIEKHLSNYVKNPYTRFDRIEVPFKKEYMDQFKLKEYPTAKFRGHQLRLDQKNTVPEDTTPNVNRDLTWTDLIYMAAIDSTSDKHVWITRYPVLDYMGSYTTRIAVLSTRNTVPMFVNGHLYKAYPDVDLSVPITELDVLFRDSINLCALYLAGLGGGDHDGDQITAKGVFSQEANAECEKIINSKSNILTVRGSSIRGIGNEGVQTLYSMTRFR